MENDKVILVNRFKARSEFVVCKHEESKERTTKQGYHSRDWETDVIVDGVIVGIYKHFFDGMDCYLKKFQAAEAIMPLM